MKPVEVLNEVYYRLRTLVPERPRSAKVALVLGGGGARAAFQTGVLRYLSEAFPDMQFPLLSGVSAGAVNVAHLANSPLRFRESTEHLVQIWRELNSERVYQEESSLALIWSFFRGGNDGLDDTVNSGNGIRSLLDPSPLREFLSKRLDLKEERLAGIGRRIAESELEAVAIATINYSTAQSVTWVEGREIELWERPNRISVNCELTLDHVMASSALPLMFPAVRIDDSWHGDGGVRLESPLSPAIHLGATHILVISTRYNRTRAEADEPSVGGYPPAAQIVGILMNSIFLDVLDQDALIIERINTLVEQLPVHRRQGLRPVQLLQIRPSVDLGKIAAESEMNLPRSLRLLIRGLGSHETSTPDWLSMLLFESSYIERLMDIGYEDARNQRTNFERFLESVLLEQA